MVTVVTVIPITLPKTEKTSLASDSGVFSAV